MSLRDKSKWLEIRYVILDGEHDSNTAFQCHILTPTDLGVDAANEKGEVNIVHLKDLPISSVCKITEVRIAPHYRPRGLHTSDG
jgi:hypothetical protein